jgi:5'-nucleotidase / UDP-sugar diphosphatase
MREIGLSCLVALAGCLDARPNVAPAPPHLVHITLFATGAENGYLLPADGRGGAARLGAQLAREGHCIGPLGPAGEAACVDGGTLLVSTGDNANGQAISSFFKGQPTAEVMKHLGYAASALGNHELDWSVTQYQANVKAQNYPYLAANVRDESGALNVLPFRLVVRHGVTLALVGLSSRKATLTPMPGRMSKVSLLPDAQALGTAITAARAAGAGVVVLLTDGCLAEVAPTLEANRAWQVAAAIGRQCEAPPPKVAGLTQLLYPGSRFQQYAKVSITVDLKRPLAEQLVVAEPSVVDVEGELAEPTVQSLVNSWKNKLDAALGEPIGYAKKNFAQDSPQMTQWLTRALREQFQTDVALLNRKGVRQNLSAGTIRQASVYDVLPFENEVFIARLPGTELIKALSNVEARYSGVTFANGKFVDSKGAPIDSKKTYSVATLDYIILGGDGFTLHPIEAAAGTKTSWQAATIEWTKAQRSTEQAPLESRL